MEKGAVKGLAKGVAPESVSGAAKEMDAEMAMATGAPPALDAVAEPGAIADVATDSTICLVPLVPEKALLILCLYGAQNFLNYVAPVFEKQYVSLSVAGFQ